MDAQSNMEKLYTIFSRALEVDRDEISDTMSQDSTPSWDSFNALKLITQLETEFHVHFTMDEAIAMKSVLAIKIALRAHGVVCDAP